MSHVQTCSVVYHAGYGGNFVKMCLSLSPDTTPYYHTNLNQLNDNDILTLYELTPADRRKIVQYASIIDYKNRHRRDVTFEPEIFYPNPLINNYYKWSIISNHPDTFGTRLPFLKKILYLDLDLSKYGIWIANSFKYFTREEKVYFPDVTKNMIVGHSIKDNIDSFETPPAYALTEEQVRDEAYCKSLPNVESVSMTTILDSLDGFVSEYTRLCRLLEITPVTDDAILYYKEWRQFRVDRFLF